MVPISVEKFADMVMENNKVYNRKELIESLQAALDAKNRGAKCMICGLRTAPSLVQICSLPTPLVKPMTVRITKSCK